MDIQKLLNNMTLEEKAGLCSGSDWWQTKDIPRLNIRKLVMRDGPHGVKVGNGVVTFCYPNLCLLACSFDTELAYKMGECLGGECREHDIDILLALGINLKRSPLCGRNFEYWSEDPVLTGKMAAAFVKGVQSTGTAVCLKHFCANNQENNRMTVSAQIREDVLREMYLRAFEIVIKEACPQTVMAAYNRVNGVYATENSFLLDQILRKEWEFDGVVVSDWAAVSDRVKALTAGLDLEMPYSGGVTDKEICHAVCEGRLNENIVNRSVERILRLHEWLSKKPEKYRLPKETDLRTIAAESIVLLKNERKVLPLCAEKDRIGVIGMFAVNPRIQGGGCANVNVDDFISPFTQIMKETDGKADYAAGYSLEGGDVDLQEALDVAARNDKVLLFIGLPEQDESECYDRKRISLPEDQLRLISAVCEKNANAVVILQNGSVVETASWKDKPAAILETYLGGQYSAQALADILFNRTNPCGRLAETFPSALEDLPAYLFREEKEGKVYYSEGNWVGYRYFCAVNKKASYPFGYGLSYTNFEYKNISFDKKELDVEDTLAIRMDVCNTGLFDGKETVQIYLEERDKAGITDRRLAAFKKCEVKKGQSQRIELKLQGKDFLRFNITQQKWMFPTTEIFVCVAKNAEDIVYREKICLKGTKKILAPITRTQRFGDLLESEAGRLLVKKYFQKYIGRAVAGNPAYEMEFDEAGNINLNVFQKNMLYSMPLCSLVPLTEGQIDNQETDRIVREINDELFGK